MCDSREGSICETGQDADWAAIVKKMNETDIDVIDVLNNTDPDAKEEFIANRE